MKVQQEKRYQKLFSEHFYLLGHEMKKNMIFHISGSTKNVYTVTIYPDKGTIFCSCPDAKSWAAKQKCVCKHCLFILYRVLKVFDGTDHPFFDRLEFTGEEMERITLSTELLRYHLDGGIVDDELTRRFSDLHVDKTENVTIRFDAEDLCGVCFLELEDQDAQNYMACPKCKKAGHKDCIRKWIESGQILCVYCRQEVWRNNKNNGRDYKNLAF